MHTKKGKGQNTLVIVANHLQIEISQAHDALADVVILEKVIEKLNISSDKIISSTVTWINIDKQEKFNEQLPEALKS